jgi:hypothetical protein
MAHPRLESVVLTDRGTRIKPFVWSKSADGILESGTD